MMTAHLRGADGEAQGIAQALKDGGLSTNLGLEEEETKEKIVLVNKAGESRSPYVRAHASNPVAWQIWGPEAIELARKENRLLFLSIGYSSCHWCHVMERESFENEEIAAILNDSFIPIKIDREERPDLDRIYMNYVHATTGSGGWPLNVFVTPELEPVFGGTYWPGPISNTTPFEGQVDFLSILEHLKKTWTEQEQRCRQDSAKIAVELKDFAAEGTFGSRLGEGDDGLDIEILEEAYNHFCASFDKQNGGFDGTPKFPTPQKLAFLLRLSQYPSVVSDIVGAPECSKAQAMAITTLRKMARGGIHDHIGNGFARYSVTADWSLPHFEKMLYDNAQLLHIYLDGFLLGRDAELLGTVYDICTYLTTTLSHPEGGFYSSEDADSFYRRGETETREGAFYVWTKRELENILGPVSEPILSAFFNVTGHGNVEPENDAHDEFLDQNVLAIVNTSATLAAQFGLEEKEIVRIIKEGKAALRAHREKERVRPGLDDKIIVSWNGLAIGALSRTAAVMKGFDPEKSSQYLEAATKAAIFIRSQLYDENTQTLYRIYREGRGDTEGFADDYAFLIEGLIDLYEATFDESWLHWADDLQQSQIQRFYDSQGTGAFFSTKFDAQNVILRLKEGMDSAEPSTNGISASNLFRLSSLLNDLEYEKKARETVTGFESEILQYPWLFSSFMPSIVAMNLGIKGVVVAQSAGNTERAERIKEFEKSPRGGLGTFLRVDEETGWLRERNSLLRDFGTDGRTRVLVCEEGACREETVVDNAVKEDHAGDVEENLDDPSTKAEEREKETTEVHAGKDGL